MAARRLQKLQGDDLTRAAQQSGSSEEDDSPGPAPYNAFELLGGDEEEVGTVAECRLPVSVSLSGTTGNSLCRRNRLRRRLSPRSLRQQALPPIPLP